MTPRILLAGTADTKSAELRYLRERIAAAGGVARVMDVGVLAPAEFVPDIDHAQVAQAGGADLESLRDCGDENMAMLTMARGAVQIVRTQYQRGLLDGLLVLGGSMGTDLALDVAAALPLGVPKVLLSTIAHSHLIAPERIAADLTMMLWAGGLYGLNSLSKATLSQAAGAVVGACRMAELPRFVQPLIGLTSFGQGFLRYMLHLKPALEARGYEVAVFHTTGMGGRAFESLAAQQAFAAVFDFSLQEISNHLGGSCVSAGPDRLRSAGRAAVPQIVAPGAIDLIDFPAWAEMPAGCEKHASHDHNRLIASAALSQAQRRAVATEIATRLAQARGPTQLLLPLEGLHGWDLPGKAFHNASARAELLDQLHQHAQELDVPCHRVPAHINDTDFCDAALAVFDAWVAQGLVPAGRRPQKPKALVLDFGGVISRTLFETHRQSEMALGLPAGSLRWRGPFDPSTDALWLDMQAERISEQEYWLRRAQEVGALLGEQWSRMETLVQRARGADVQTVIRPEAVQAIEQARAHGIKLGILSNELDLFYGADFRNRLPLLACFDAIVDATYTGVLKPAPEAYTQVAQALGVTVSDCVFVDDQARNVVGAQRAGMRAVAFDVQAPAKSFAQALQALGLDGDRQGLDKTIGTI